MTPQRPALDQDQRDLAIHERERNVLVDAGAGTGKTTLLVDRLVEMVAPPGDGPAVALSRIAAITFTRKAADELRLRVRERLLTELASPLTPVRRRRLSEASTALDTAHIGTIHGFADRLLRVCPVEARLGPSYEVVEDGSELYRETFAVLLHAVQAGTLAQELDGAIDPAWAQEAQDAILDALHAGLRAESREGEWTTSFGLDSLLAGFIQSRDVPPPEPAPPRLQLADLRAAMREFCRRAKGVQGDGGGAAWVRRSARRLESLEGEDDPVVLLREVNRVTRGIPRDMTKKRAFTGDEAGWRLWKAWLGDGAAPERRPPLRDDLLGPLHRWMATRLVRAYPAVVAVYQKVKARRRSVDPVDLLLLLRNLLRDDREVRGGYQKLFDHLFVDEFQDTDPLQAEIVLYLCEREPRARDWRDVLLAPGRLTLVGDPKQSIYRFRRADIAVYDTVRAIVLGAPHLSVSLSSNFRSDPGLIAWLNGRFDEILGKAEKGMPVFDRDRGTVANEPLAPGREAGGPLTLTLSPTGGEGTVSVTPSHARGEGMATPRVKILPCGAEDDSASGHRTIEGAAIATFLRWMVDGKKVPILDPSTGLVRPAGYGDVAVLAASTYHLGRLFAELDRLGVPYAARGGTLFLEDPAHRQFLLGLRAVADRDDGVAQAALLRPPFFAVDLAELARERAAPAESQDPGVLRARAALAWVRELRRRRLERPPDDTARDLLEETGFGRAVALGPNGAQRLDRVRELCLALARVASAEGLDYDGATARLRDWVTDPVPFDPPRPVSRDAVEVLTVHQAKGLEFPAVVLWDGRADWQVRGSASPWRMDRDGVRWALAIDGLEWEEPEGASILEREKRYLAAERARLVYVAATRARDLLVLPIAGDDNAGYVTGRLALGSPEELVERLDPFVPGDEPAWAREISPPPERQPRVVAELAASVEKAWSEASAEAGRPLFSPAAVSTEAHASAPGDAEGWSGPQRKSRPGRHGRAFGDTVHLAIGLALRSGLEPQVVVERAARETGLAANLGEAVADVDRALAALAREGLRRTPGPDLQLEYPVVSARHGRLYSGYVDLLAVEDDRVVVLDFKTDQPPAADVGQSHPDYVEQVRSYARILAELGLAAGRTVRCGLLFTADGRSRWVT